MLTPISRKSSNVLIETPPTKHVSTPIPPLGLFSKQTTILTKKNARRCSKLGTLEITEEENDSPIRVRKTFTLKQHRTIEVDSVWNKDRRNTRKIELIHERETSRSFLGHDTKVDEIDEFHSEDIS